MSEDVISNNQEYYETFFEDDEYDEYDDSDIEEDELLDDDSNEEEISIEEVFDEQENEPLITSNDNVILDNDSEWKFDLPSVGRSVSINEFGLQEFLYEPIYNPNNEFNGFYKCHANIIGHEIDGTKIWHPMRILLSKKYKGANLEKFIQILSSKYNFLGAPIIYNAPFLLEYSREIEINNDQIIDTVDSKIISMFVGKTNEEEISSIRNKLMMSVINTYDGRGKLCIDYYVISVLKDEKTNKEFRVPNYFILFNLIEKVRHMGSLGIQTTNFINSVNDKINDNINILKNMSVTEETYDIIVNMLGKRLVKDIHELWDRLPDDYKNMYYFLNLASLFLMKNYRTNKRVDISKFLLKNI